MRSMLVPARARAPLLMLVVLASSPGCATMNVTTPELLNGEGLDAEGEPLGHIHGANWGWYLFKFIPIVTGSLDRPGDVRWPAWFSDQVTIDKVVNRVTRKAKELGASRVADLRTTDKSHWSAKTLIFWLKEIEVTANAVR